MSNVIAVANQKGGVGKTTTTHALVAGLTAKGYRVLAIDLDPQGNLSLACRADNKTRSIVYHVMKGSCEAKDAVQHVLGGFDIIPASINLSGAEQAFVDTGKEFLLAEAISPIATNYDYIVIDTPPSLGVLTTNAFTFANEILIPTTASVFAAGGIKQLSDTIARIKKYFNSKVKIAGILLTRYNGRTNVGKSLQEITEDMAAYIKVPVYKTHIRAAVAIEEAQVAQMDIL